MPGKSTELLSSLPRHVALQNGPVYHFGYLKKNVSDFCPYSTGECC